MDGPDLPDFVGVEQCEGVWFQHVLSLGAGVCVGVTFGAFEEGHHDAFPGTWADVLGVPVVDPDHVSGAAGGAGLPATTGADDSYSEVQGRV